MACLLCCNRRKLCALLWSTTGTVHVLLLLSRHCLVRTLLGQALLSSQVSTSRDIHDEVTMDNGVTYSNLLQALSVLWGLFGNPRWSAINQSGLYKPVQNVGPVLLCQAPIHHSHCFQGPDLVCSTRSVDAQEPLRARHHPAQNLLICDAPLTHLFSATWFRTWRCPAVRRVSLLRACA